nr:mesoderm development candidate 2 [Tanacetum cinerariifolium]
MAIHIRPILYMILFIAFVTINVTATKKRVHIPDDLHDVKDNEEDEAWIEWGQKKRMTVEEFDPPPENFSDLDFTQMQEEVMKRQVGQSYGFVKLRLTDDPRTPLVADCGLWVLAWVCNRF